MSRADFREAIDAYRALTAGSITSEWRTVKHNAAVGGVARSPHLFGLAADVIYDAPVPRADALEWASRLGLRLLRRADHDHLQPLDWKAG